jgi:hypothetical protein
MPLGQTSVFAVIQGSIQSWCDRQLRSSGWGEESDRLAAIVLEAVRDADLASLLNQISIERDGSDPAQVDRLLRYQWFFGQPYYPEQRSDAKGPLCARDAETPGDFTSGNLPIGKLHINREWELKPLDEQRPLVENPFACKPVKIDTVGTLGQLEQQALRRVPGPGLSNAGSDE